ncbi:MAG: hypothetical protein C4321_03900, partial [Chloroflexota bacterium]
MKQLALSTMFAQQERFEDGAMFARFAAEAGYEAIEISHSTPAEKIDAIRRAGLLPIVSVHQPAPYLRLPNGRGNSSLNLAALDEDERRAAVAAAQRSVTLAAELGASRIVVHLGHVGPSDQQFEEELALRRAYDAGERSLPDEPQRRNRTWRRLAVPWKNWSRSPGRMESPSALRTATTTTRFPIPRSTRPCSKVSPRRRWATGTTSATPRSCIDSALSTAMPGSAVGRVAVSV